MKQSMAQQIRTKGETSDNTQPERLRGNFQKKMPMWNAISACKIAKHLQTFNDKAACPHLGLHFSQSKPSSTPPYRSIYFFHFRPEIYLICIKSAPHSFLRANIHTEFGFCKTKNQLDRNTFAQVANCIFWTKKIQMLFVKCAHALPIRQLKSWQN